MVNKPYRVGILGGTFNPIHYGHLAIAQAALEQFALDCVCFMPTGHAPHKSFSGDAMSRHRTRMVELALDHAPYFFVSRRELEGSEVNYTYQTLMQLNAEYPNTEFFFILGADSLFDFPTWRHPERICREAAILVAVRDDFDRERINTQIRQLQETYHGEFYPLDTPMFPYSSSEIRKRVALGQEITQMVPPAVAAYLKEQRLYIMEDPK